MGIPKTIHLTWFSGDAMPKQLQRCVESWKSKLPDFKIKVWDSDMARALNIPFVNEALDAHKWAFAGDVVRAYAVWKFGGVYMDTDVEVVKRFDEFLDKPIVFFIERNEKQWSEQPKGIIDNNGYCTNPDVFVLGRQIQAAMFMGMPGQKCLGEIVNYYKHQHFIDGDGNFNMRISPSIYAKILEKYGFRYIDDSQLLGGGIYIFPSKYVALSPYERVSETIAIHLGAHAWDPRSPWKQIKYKIRMSIVGPWLAKLINRSRQR